MKTEGRKAREHDGEVRSDESIERTEWEIRGEVRRKGERDGEGKIWMTSGII